MPLIQDGKKPTRYNPIRSLTYNPAARGFDLRYTNKEDVNNYTMSQEVKE